MFSKKYTVDYRLENIMDKNGKLVTKPVYVGRYSVFVAPEEEVGKYRTVYTAAVALSIVFFVLGFAVSVRTMPTAQYYSVIPQAVCVFPFIYEGAALYYMYTLAFGKMTREQRDKITDRTSGTSLCGMIFSAVAFAGGAVGLILFFCGIIKAEFSYRDIIYLLSNAAIFALQLVIFVGRKKLTTKEIGNPGETDNPSY